MLTPGACEFCSAKAQPPRTINEVTVSLAVGEHRENREASGRIMAEYGHLLRREYPTWAKQAWSAAVAVADWVSSGARGVTREVYQARLAKCDGCPNRDGHRCRVCGCYIRGKASLPTESCPIGLWAKEVP